MGDLVKAVGKYYEQAKSLFDDFMVGKLIDGYQVDGLPDDPKERASAGAFLSVCACQVFETGKPTIEMNLQEATYAQKLFLCAMEMEELVGYGIVKKTDKKDENGFPVFVMEKQGYDFLRNGFDPDGTHLPHWGQKPTEEQLRWWKDITKQSGKEE